ncbi:MAG: phenylacetate--CoA ligase family protein [Ardenticatenaceae bacterium]
MSWLDEFYRTFDERVREIVAYGYDHSPAFRRRMEGVGLVPADIESAVALGRLPVLRKEELPALHAQGEALGGMLTVPVRSLRRLFQSPGPIYEPEPDEPDPWRWAPALRAVGFGPGDIVFNAFSYHLTPAGAMFEEGARAVGCTVVPGGVGNQAQQVETMAALGVTAFVGLPSYLKALLEKAREMALPLRLDKALVSAEPLPPSLRALLQDEYGVEVYQVYGTAECGNLGYEGPERSGWHLPADALVQVCDLNSGQPLPPGETGEVVATLFRRDYILVRLAVGDLSAIADSPDDGTVRRPRLVGWLGRSGDSVKVRGLFVHPRHADDALRLLEGLAHYQVVITRHEHRDDLTCRIVPAAGSNKERLLATVEQTLSNALKLHCRAEIVDSLSPDAPRFLDERTWA